MSLPEFNRELAIKMAGNALREVADFPEDADITSFTFSHFHDFHKQVFSLSLKININKINDNNYYFDIIINPDIINSWSTINDCVEYLINENMMRSGSTRKVQL